MFPKRKRCALIFRITEMCIRDLELLRYVLRCAIERQLYFPSGMNQVYRYCYCYVLWRYSPLSDLNALVHIHIRNNTLYIY